jgi:hypothetical protein
MRLPAQWSPALKARLEHVAQLFRDDPSGYDTLFSKRFLAAVPPERMTELLTGFYKKRGSIVRIEPADTSKANSGKARFITSMNYAIDVSMSVSKSAPNLIEGLLFGVANPNATSIPEVMKQVAQLGTTTFYAAELMPRSDRVIGASNQSAAFPLGSAFKLFVLATLVDEIEQGKRKWDDVVKLDEASRALPSGHLHTWPVASPLTLHTVAALMISESDNTATDLLIHTLGRAHVERMLKTLGVAASERDLPLLTVFEMFKLKSMGRESIAERYKRASVAEKRKILDVELAAVHHDSVEFNEAGLPVDIDTVEWFASGEDLSRVLRWIRDHSASDKTSPARSILAINPGLRIDRTKWEYAGFKGGSEPGVLNLTYLLRSTAGKWYVLTVGWKDTKAPLDEESFLGIVQRALELLE